MPTRANGYYNDPTIGQAFNNLSSMFAPPSGADAAGYARAKAMNEEGARLAKFFELAADPTMPRDAFDRYGVAAGRYTPNQSYYNVDQTQATSRANNAADNARAVAVQRYGPLSEGQTLPAMPGSVAKTYGLPESGPVVGAVKLNEGQQATLPDGRVLKGAPKPLSSSDIMSYVLPDGKTGSARAGADGVLVDTQTGAPLPQGVRPFKATVQATGVEGIGKPTNNNIERQVTDLRIARDTAVKLREIVASSPASQGAVGALRGTAQNIIQSGGELGSYFGGSLKEVSDAINTGAADANIAGAFDPNIPAIEMLSNLLAFQYAKTTTGERLSNEMLRASKAALGLDGLTANQASTLTRINQAIERMDAQERLLLNIRGGGIGPAQAAPAAPAVNSAVAPSGGAERWERGPDGKLRRAQ